MEKRIVRIEKLAAGGFGVGHANGQTLLVSGALPGEEVEAEILARRAGAVLAKPIRILVPHPMRRKPVCPHFLDCGGCQFLHLADAAQPTLKLDVLRETLTRASLVLPDDILLNPAPGPLFYRHRVRFQVALHQGRLGLGFFASRSRRLVPIAHCHLLDPRINKLLPDLAAWLEHASDEPGPPDRLEVLAGLEGEGILLTADLPAKPTAWLAAWLEAGPETPEPIQVFYSVRNRLKFSPGASAKAAVTVFQDPDSGIRLKAGPGAFTQVNPEVNRLLVRDVVQAARDLNAKRILDLYCGLGNFTLPLARMSRQAEGFDENPMALAAARFNQEANLLRNVRFHRQRSEAAVKTLAGQGRTFDLVVMDPPRSGARGLAPDLARLQPREILYVSCHPAALARDLIELRSVGFFLKCLTAYDMFPQTGHLEVLALLGL